MAAAAAGSAGSAVASQSSNSSHSSCANPSLQLNPWLSFRHPQDPEISKEERNAGVLWWFFQNKTTFSEKKRNPTALGSEHTSTIHKGNPLLSLESWELMALTKNFYFSVLQCNPSPVTHKKLWRALHKHSAKGNSLPKNLSIQKATAQPNQDRSTKPPNDQYSKSVLPAKPFPVFLKNLERLQVGLRMGIVRWFCRCLHAAAPKHEGACLK